jgi:hypothetical protein
MKDGMNEYKYPTKTFSCTECRDTIKKTGAINNI